MRITQIRPITSCSVVGCGKSTFVFLAETAFQTHTYTTNQPYNIMLNQILSTCKQLNRLLKAKDPYHADLVGELLDGIAKSLNETNPQGVDKDAIVEALNKKD